VSRKRSNGSTLLVGRRVLVWDGEMFMKIKIECRSCLLQTKEIGVLKTQIVIK